MSVAGSVGAVVFCCIHLRISSTLDSEEGRKFCMTSWTSDFPSMSASVAILSPWMIPSRIVLGPDVREVDAGAIGGLPEWVVYVREYNLSDKSVDWYGFGSR